MFPQIKNFIKNRKISNYFKTNFDKNVLISYIVYPLRFKKSDGHNNQLEIKTIVNIFKKLNYNVDVVFYSSNEKINYEKYDLIFGFGKPFMNSSNSKKNLKRIFYATGSHPDFQNSQTKKRAEEVFAKTGLMMLDSCRLVKEYSKEQYSIADAIILLGSEFTKKTYGNISNKIFTINTFFNPNLSNLDSILPINENMKRSFLYFTSNGAIHRGLDILLEFFEKNEQYDLYISSNLDKEKEFLNYYDSKLSKKNIHYLGYNSVLSQDFKKLIDRCAFSILPSSSEGQSTSITNLSACGLIPLITKECGFDLGSKSITIEDIDFESIKEAVNKSQTMSLKEIGEKRKEVKKYFSENYTLTNFEKHIQSIILKIIN